MATGRRVMLGEAAANLNDWATQGVAVLEIFQKVAQREVQDSTPCDLWQRAKKLGEQKEEVHPVAVIFGKYSVKVAELVGNWEAHIIRTIEDGHENEDIAKALDEIEAMLKPKPKKPKAYCDCDKGERFCFPRKGAFWWYWHLCSDGVSSCMEDSHSYCLFCGARRTRMKDWEA